MKTNLNQVIKSFNKKSKINFDNLYFTDLTFCNKVKRLSYINKNHDEFVNQLIKYVQECK
jgi:hypothetical protein